MLPEYTTPHRREPAAAASALYAEEF